MYIEKMISKRLKFKGLRTKKLHVIKIIFIHPVLLGYERYGVVGGLSIESTETSVVHGLGGGLAKNTKNATYLNIYATLQPALIGK